MCVEILDSDEISRCIIFDRAFKEDMYIDEYLWRFGSTSAVNDVYFESAVLRRLAPTSEDVHRIGCGIAASQNEHRADRLPGPNRRYYCGFKSASCASLPRSGEGFELEITNRPEDGEIAHVDVKLRVTVSGKSARANTRTLAGIILAEQFGPTVPHRCSNDADDSFHPFSRWGLNCLNVDTLNSLKDYDLSKLTSTVSSRD